MPSAVAASKRNPKANDRRRPRRGSLISRNDFKIKAFSEREIESCFDSFDLDGNGFISAAEISHYLKSLGERVTDREIDEMIKMCDRDGDGQIDLAEFAGMVHREAGRRRRRRRKRQSGFGGLRRFLSVLQSVGDGRLQRAVCAVRARNVWH